MNGEWKGERVGGFSFRAEVPGCTIFDLVQNGYLPKDLLCARNADAVLQYENDDWIYTKSFFLEQACDRAVLSFGRIDTYADIYLNGALLAHTENGNISHAFDATEAVVQGENLLQIRFFSPIRQVQGLPKRDGAFTTERLYTRRMQCTYGWDWVARFVTCGIGDAALLCYERDEAILRGAYIFTERVERGAAHLRVEAEFEGRIATAAVFEILSPAGDAVYRAEAALEGDGFSACAVIGDARLWYPVGYGDQPLYTLRITDGARVLHEERFGIRTAEILEVEDAVGSEAFEKCRSIKNPEYDKNESFSSFTLLINGQRIMCKGANWVPCQPYEMPLKEEKITRILELSVKMGLNMIRVWGGGAFECKHFYDECSRLGILVTQDFLMACGSYPEKESRFLEHLQREAAYACLLMRNQPCLVWYSGDNENAVNGSFLDADYKGKSAYEQGMKPTVEALDRSRRFLPSSPYGGNKFASNTVGTTHNTQFLGQFFEYIEDGTRLFAYKEEMKKYRARFVAEEPVFGATSLSSLRKFMTEEEIFSEDMAAWLYHTKGNPGLGKELMHYFLRLTEGIFGKFKNPEDRFFKYKYLAYEWIRVVMEQARREKWFCSGEIFWMLNDCWTAASGWALIDYFNKPKLGYYAFKRCAAPILSSIDYEDGEYRFFVSNDAQAAYRARVVLYLVKEGAHRPIGEFEMLCPAGESVSRKIEACLAEGEVLVAELSCEAGDCRAFYKAGDLRIEKCGEGAIEYSAMDGCVTLLAREYLQAVELEGEAIFEENGFSMLAGERKTVRFEYLPDASDEIISAQAYTLSVFKE